MQPFTAIFFAALILTLGTRIWLATRHIRHIQALAGNLPIHSRSWLQRADVSRWFRVIGYVERGQENGATVFELPPARAAASARAA